MCAPYVDVKKYIEHLGPSDSPIEHLGPSDSPIEHLGPSDSPIEHLGPSDSPIEHLGPSDSPIEHLGPSDSPHWTLRAQWLPINVHTTCHFKRFTLLFHVVGLLVSNHTFHEAVCWSHRVSVG